MRAKSPEVGQEDLFRTILDSVSDGVTVIDRDLRIQYQNQTVRQLFGSRIGEHCYQAYRKLHEPCRDCMVLDVLKDGRERRGFRDIPLPNGEVSLLEISSAAVRSPEGEIIGAAEVARDVTHQKRAEALLNRTLLERNEVLKRLNSELGDAAGYVKTVLPLPIRSGALRTDWRFIPSKSLGGDSFGYHWLDPDHFAFYLVDVSGHGWAAALLSVSVINVLRAQALPGIDFHAPEQVLSALNQAFPSERHNDMFFTIWYGLFAAPSRKLVYASGGHPPGLLLAGPAPEEASAEELRTPNVIIGCEANASFQSAIKEIHTSSRLFIFSDGVFDITQSDGSIWGFKAFRELMQRPPAPGQSALDRLVSRAKALSNKDTFDDDFSILEIDFQ